MHVTQQLLTALLFLSAAATGTSQERERSMARDPSLDNLVHPDGYEAAARAAFGRVDKRGHGDVPMVLIAGGGFGADVFEPFIERHEDVFTMYAVTLAGMGGTQAPPMPPPGTSYGEQSWIRGGVEALVKLIETEKLDRPIVAGHFLAGSQIGFRMAIDHEELIRGVVLFAGTGVMAVPNMSPTLEERIRYQDENMAPNWFKTVTLRTWNDNNFPPQSYSLDPERGQALFDDVSHGPLPVVIRYLLEFWSSDITLELDDVARPVLVLTPGFTEAMLEDEATRWLGLYFFDGLEGIEANPLIQRRVIDDAAIFVWLDQPERVSEEVTRFVKALEAK